MLLQNRFRFAPFSLCLYAEIIKNKVSQKYILFISLFLSHIYNTRLTIDMGSVCQTEQSRPDYYFLIRSKQLAQFSIPDLRQLNHYQPPRAQYNQNIQKTQIITNNQAFQLFDQYNKSPQVFEDYHYKLQEESAMLKQLGRRHMKPVLLDNPSPLNLIQNNEQYTYLSAVFCYIADMKEHFKNIFCTVINDLEIYIVELHPNGTQLFTIVDSYVPVDRQNIKYSSSKRAEIWMCVLQKAWTKLIGSYQKAKGLSPQDALQQILGIPAFSYQIYNKEDAEFESAIKINKNEGACILFIAHQSLQLLKGDLFPRQVFYLSGFQKIQSKWFYKLICPCQNFNFGKSYLSSLNGQEASYFQNYQKQNKNVIFVSPHEIHFYFQFCTIGYFKPHYTTRSIQLAFGHQNAPKYFKIIVQKQQAINIRICQFYQGYVRENLNYSYSSVYIRLWNLNNRSLVSEGCNRAIYEVKSSSVFPEIFRKLELGQYLLSVDIPWKFPHHISKAQLTTYSKYPLQLQQLQTLQGYSLERSFLIESIPEQQIKFEADFNYIVYWMRNSMFIYINGRNQEPLKLKIKMGNSHNLFPVNYTFENKTLELKLEPKACQIVQFRKIKVQERGEIGSFVFQLV